MSIKENLEDHGYSIEKALSEYADISEDEAKNMTSKMSLEDYSALTNALDSESDQQITDIVDRYTNNIELEESFSAKDYILNSDIDTLNENFNEFIQYADVDNFVKSDLMSKFSLYEQFVYKNYLPENIKYFYDLTENMGIIEMGDYLSDWDINVNELSLNELRDLTTFKMIREENDLSPEDKTNLSRLVGKSTAAVNKATYNDPQSHDSKTIVAADPTSRTVATMDDDTGDVHVKKVTDPKSEITLEARKEGVKYSEKKMRGEINKVVAELKNTDSSSMTRLARKYAQIDRLSKRIAAQRDKLNKEATEAVESLFDVEDEIYTRVVETISLSMTLSKKEEERTVTTTTFDADGFVDELFELMPSLESALLELKEKYTKVETITHPARKPSLRVKVKENVIKDLYNKLKDYATKFKDYIMSKLRKFDDGFNSLKRKVDNAVLDESLQLKGFEDNSIPQYDHNSEVDEMRRLAGLI